MKTVGVILAGSGVYDGAEIHEAVLTMLALDKRGVNMVIAAPNVNQYHVVNHLNGQEMNETRNVLIEAARIARGNIKDIKDVNPSELDAVILPGGFGVARNLCDFAFKGEDCTVNPDVLDFLTEIVKEKKPLGAVCIAPVLVSKIYEKLGKKAELTIGTDKETADKVQKMGNTHVSCLVKEFHIDKENNIVSTPAYMLGQRISEVAEGIDKTVEALLGLIK
jgi:enhancing lycopene biosynthesis protein 2